MHNKLLIFAFGFNKSVYICRQFIESICIENSYS